MTDNGLKDLLQSAVQLNKDHQYALNVSVTQTFQTAAELEEEELYLDIAGSIQVAGARKPLGLLSSTELLSEDSPFYDDATRRQRFLSFTEYHPMKPKEAESLREAVRLENRRLRAYEAQRRGEHPFASQHSMEDLESQRVLIGSALLQRGRADKFLPKPLVSDSRSVDPSGQLESGEDAQLRLAVDLYGNAWMEVASFIPGRTNEQCRDRWSSRLNPKVPRGKWTAEEDARLLSAVDEFGVEKWKEASSSRKTQAMQAEGGGSEMIEKDGAQPELIPALPAGSPRTTPQGAPVKPSENTSTSNLEFSATAPGSDATTCVWGPYSWGSGIPSCSPRTQGVENEDLEKDTPRLSHKRPSTLHQRNRADKRQKISDQIQSKVPETMDRSADVNAAAEASAAESPLLDNTDMGVNQTKGACCAEPG
ncbi:hypothetical protein BJV77DRAFT_1064287 [Russula vinacea]|nr:hypothetical protein BJV77DRAFT_1064287 [Russula vinacea]